MMNPNHAGSYLILDKRHVRGNLSEIYRLFSPFGPSKSVGPLRASTLLYLKCEPCRGWYVGLPRNAISDAEDRSLMVKFSEEAGLEGCCVCGLDLDLSLPPDPCADSGIMSCGMFAVAFCSAAWANLGFVGCWTGGITGLPGALATGVFGLEIQTPSTSMPLSMARIPNGTSGFLPLLLVARCISC